MRKFISYLFDDTAATEIYAGWLVGSVRCV